MDQLKTSNFMSAISEKFVDIKKEFKINIKRAGLAFDDDIFSDTIIKCNNKLQETSMNRNEMIAYFWMAFKNNTLRELGYARNNTTDEIPENLIDDIYDETNDIFDTVSKMIIDEFGEELYQLFSLHANGMQYEELYLLTNIDNLKYKFRRIREYIRNNFWK